MENKPVEDLSKEEIFEALTTPTQRPAISLDETVEELKAMGIRSIEDYDLAGAMGEAMKNVQIQKTLHDISRQSKDRKSPRDYLEHHIEFLASISPGKTKGDIVNGMTLEHALSVLKTTAKMNDIPEAVIKKHIKNLKKKYN